jgi:hypothetical protein
MIRGMSIALLLVLAILPGLDPPANATSGQGAASGESAAEADPVPPATLPPPFTAAELRAGIPAGTEITLRVANAGAAPVITQRVFVAADERGCTIQSRVLAEDGSLVRDDGTATTTWEELESHAHFPAARTRRSESSVEVPAGRFATWLFEVLPDDPAGPTRRFHFAPELPGPPVSMEVVQGDTVVMTMELVSRTRP